MKPNPGELKAAYPVRKSYSKGRVKVEEELATRDSVGRRELPDNKASAPFSCLFSSSESSTAAGQA